MAVCAHCLGAHRSLPDGSRTITSRVLEKGKPEHAVIRSLPQGHLLKPVTALLAGPELPAHAESQGNTGKATLTALLSDGQLPQQMLAQKALSLCLSLRMLPLQRLQQELGARAGLQSSASRAGGTRLALNSGSGLGTQALLVLQHRAGNLTPAARKRH